MPPASEACVTILREPDPFVSPFAGWWHALQGAFELGAMARGWCCAPRPG